MTHVVKRIVQKRTAPRLVCGALGTLLGLAAGSPAHALGPAQDSVEPAGHQVSSPTPERMLRALLSQYPVLVTALSRRLTSAGVAAEGTTAAPFRPAEGSFVRYNGWTFRIAGGAPVYVSNWAAVGGTKPSIALTEDQYGSLALFPRDGTFVTASDGRVYRFVAGAPFYVSTWAAFGTSQPSIRIDSAAIAHAGGDEPWSSISDATIDLDVKAMEEQPAPHEPFTLWLNGKVFIRGAQTGRVYKMVSGAPMYVSNWKLFGGPQPTVTVDQAAIDHAGQAGLWRFVHKHVASRLWFVRGVQTGQIFSVVGGAPIYVANAAILSPGFDPASGSGGFRIVPANIDQTVIERGSGPAPYDNLRYVPADGTYLAASTVIGGIVTEGLRFYRVETGAPIEVNEQDVPEKESFSFGSVDQTAVDRAGQTGVWSHLRKPAQ